MVEECKVYDNRNRPSNKVVFGHLSQPEEYALPFKSWPSSELWPNVKPGDNVGKFGLVFKWTAEHQVGGQLEVLRTCGDDLADRALDEIDGSFQVAGYTKGGDAWSVIDGSATPACVAFVDSVSHVPSWVDWEQLERGRNVFLRYGPGAGIGLMYLSLVGGFGAPKINKVLTSTGECALFPPFHLTSPLPSALPSC